ncbi:acyl-CoA thioesterase [Herpetosiphon gulosus]|uniref:4-hydroxybenzoyl-CoA thioesterase n=1 Tax=Herpetosiphon gulosus TaxID=1973496 RepID=A0ABP9X567_9CHLR
MHEAYEYRHIVGFEETNLVGNVYYANYVLWQGRCREMFLRDHTPELVQALAHDLALVTTSVSCEYHSELFAFDDVVIEMRLKELLQNRALMSFRYFRQNADSRTLVAQGEQGIACMRRTGDELQPEPFPAALRAALQRYYQ